MEKSGGGIQGQVVSKSSFEPQVDGLGVEKGRTGYLRQTVWILGARKTTDKRLSEPLMKAEGRKSGRRCRQNRSGGRHRQNHGRGW